MIYYSSQWLSMPRLQMLAGGTQWVNLEPYLVITDCGDRFIVPPSNLALNEDLKVKYPIWTTDLGSVPEVFQNIVKAKYGPNVPGFVAHDWLYTSQIFSREKSDLILKSLCTEDHEVIYEAVHLFGGSVWDKHTSESIASARAFYQATLDELPERWPELQAKLNPPLEPEVDYLTAD